jgi:nucleotide-binding universal stress UspA family protein
MRRQIRILVPLDGSALAERALSQAADMARVIGAQLRLVSAVPPIELLVYRSAELAQLATVSQHQERITAGARLAATARRLRTCGLSVDAVVQDGPPATVIDAMARTIGADLIVMATHGESGWGPRLYGSVAEDVVRKAAAPVLLVAPWAVVGWPTDRAARVLVSLDGSQLAEAALPVALRLAGSDGTIVKLVRAVDSEPLRAGLASERVCRHIGSHQVGSDAANV